MVPIEAYRRCQCLRHKRLLSRRCPCRVGLDLVLSDNCRTRHPFCRHRLGRYPVDPGWTPKDSCPVRQFEKQINYHLYLGNYHRSHRYISNKFTYISFDSSSFHVTTYKVMINPLKCFENPKEFNFGFGVTFQWIGRGSIKKKAVSQFVQVLNFTYVFEIVRRLNVLQRLFIKWFFNFIKSSTIKFRNPYSNFTKKL